MTIPVPIQTDWEFVARYAIEATLLFHSGSPWDERQRLRWIELTGDGNATSKALCDFLRGALNEGQEIDGLKRQARGGNDP